MGYNFFIYSANFLPNIGGVEKFTDNLARQLVAMGHSATIVTNNVFGLANHEVLDSGAEVFRLPCHSLFNGRLPLPKHGRKFNNLRDDIYTKPVDYIIINTRFYPHTFIGAQHATAKGIKPIIIDHGSAYLTFGNKAIDPLVKAYEHAITHALKTRYSANFYGVSQASAAWLETFGIKASGVINNSIDADQYLKQASDKNFREQFGENAFIISFTGRLIPEKGIATLIGAAERLSEDATIKFLIAGDGPLMSKLKKSNPGNIHTLGKLESADIAALLRQSDVFCLPTRSEGFSTSLLEAAACYTAPIITNVGGVSEMIPSEDYGVILKTQSCEEVSLAITTLKESPVRLSNIGKNIGKRVRDYFSWQRTADLAIAACKKANSLQAITPKRK